MNMSEFTKKIFGVALDPADDPFTLQLKGAWMSANQSDLDWLSTCVDPYDAVTKDLEAVLEKQHIKLVGKFPVPSWLWPRPKPSDLLLVNATNMGNVFDSGYLLETTKRLKSFIIDAIFPGTPLMLGVDHSSTAGVVSALAERYDPKRLTVVVLDQHFDAIPLSVRLKGIPQLSPNRVTVASHLQEAPIGFSDSFCCGNFWAYLINEGIVLPENLIFIGVGDYPSDHNTNPEGDGFRQSYLKYQKSGCSFFPLQQFKRHYLTQLTRFLQEKIRNPYVYLSADLDVGSYAATYAARYMDRPGISRAKMLNIARIIKKGCNQRKFEIVGLDVMEFNMHFLGIDTPGFRDNTIQLVRDYLAALT